MMRNKLVLFLTLSLGGAVLMSSSCFAEEITITTYYPSPYGSYNELRSKRMAIGDNYLQMSQVCWGAACGGATIIPDAADLVVEGSVGIGTPAPVAKLDIRDVGGLSNLDLHKTGTHIRHFNAGGTQKFYWFLDDANNQLQLRAAPSTNVILNIANNGVIGFQGLAADPAAVAGGIYYNSTDAEFKYSDGTGWAALGGGGGCYVSYSGSCLAGFTDKGSAGWWGYCRNLPSSYLFRPPGGGCPGGGGWASFTLGGAVVCCQ